MFINFWQNTTIYYYISFSILIFSKFSAVRKKRSKCISFRVFFFILYLSVPHFLETTYISFTFNFLPQFSHSTDLDQAGYLTFPRLLEHIDWIMHFSLRACLCFPFPSLPSTGIIWQWLEARLFTPCLYSRYSVYDGNFWMDRHCHGSYTLFYHLTWLLSHSVFSDIRSGDSTTNLNIIIDFLP